MLERNRQRLQRRARLDAGKESLGTRTQHGAMDAAPDGLSTNLDVVFLMNALRLNALARCRVTEFDETSRAFGMALPARFPARGAAGTGP